MSTFLQGFQTGQDFFNERNKQAIQAEELEMRKAAAQREAEEFAQRREQYNRNVGIQRATDEAWDARNNLEKNGVMTGNKSGMSDASAQMLYGQGGQQAVDDTASYGNAENVRFGLRPQYTTSQGATPDAPAAPTVAMRKATDRDRLAGDMNVALASRDMNAATAIQGRMRDLDKRDIYNKVGQMSDDAIRAKLPALNASEMSGLPIYDAGDVLDAKGKPTGYRELKIVKDGKSEIIQVSPAQLRQIAVAHALMEGGFGEEGIAALAAVHKDMADLVGKYNTTLKGAVDSGNTAIGHRDTAINGRITANAAATNAATNKAYKDKQIEVLDNAEARRQGVGKLAMELNALDPADKDYDKKRRDILTKIDVENLKPGGQVSLRDPSAGGKGGNSAALKYETDNLWADAEKKLVGDNVPPREIAEQKAQFYARRGVAPNATLQALYEGRDPITGEKMTEESVAIFESTFPNTPIDRSKLKWLQAKKPTGMDTRSDKKLTKQEAAANRAAAWDSLSNWASRNIGPADTLISR